MSKRFSSIIVATVSSFLLNSASFAGLDCNSCHENDPTGSKSKAAAFHYTVSKPNSDEARWWNEFETSKEKDITRYVEDLASKDAKAATWFLLTGGKYGFSGKIANAEETALLLSAMKKVAQFFGNSNDRMQGLQEWATAKASVESGHLHLQMLYKEVNKLKEDNKSLNFEVSSLKTKQQETEKRLSASERKQQELADQLEQERIDRKKELEDLKKLLETKRIEDITTLQNAFNKTLEASDRSAKERYTQNPSSQTQQYYLNMIDQLKQSKSKTKDKLKEERKDKNNLFKEFRSSLKEERDELLKQFKEERKDKDEWLKQFNDHLKEQSSVLDKALNAITLMLEKK